MNNLKAFVFGIIAVAVVALGLSFVARDADASWVYKEYPPDAESPDAGYTIYTTSGDGEGIQISCVKASDGGYSADATIWLNIPNIGDGKWFFVSTGLSSELWNRQWLSFESKYIYVPMYVGLSPITPQKEFENLAEFLMLASERDGITIRIENERGVVEALSFSTRDLRRVEDEFLRKCDPSNVGAYPNDTERRSSSRHGGNGDTPLHTAIRHNDIPAARRIVASSSLRQLCETNHLKQTPWGLASILDANEIQLMLISANATWQCDE